MDTDTTVDNEENRSSRRDIIKKGAIVGGVAVWGTPVIQTLAAGPAAAANSFLCAGSSVNVLAVGNSQFSITPGSPTTAVYRHTVTSVTFVCGNNCDIEQGFPKYTWNITNLSANANWPGDVSDQDTFTDVNVTDCTTSQTWSVSVTLQLQCHGVGTDPVLSCSRSFDFATRAGCSVVPNAGVVTNPGTTCPQST